MIKKILSVLLILTLIISLFAGIDFTLPTASAVQVIKSGDYECTVNDNNEITIKNYLGNDREVSIPSEIDGMPVREIGDYSFNGFLRPTEDGQLFENHPNEKNNKKIRRIYVPSTVRTIRENAFGNMSRLNEVVLVNGLETIEPYAFSNCPKLENISLPDSLVNFNLIAFDGTAIEEIVLGPNVRMPVLTDGKGTIVRKITCNADSVYFTDVYFEGTTAIDEIVINGRFTGGYINRKASINKVICNGEVTCDAVFDMKKAGFGYFSDAGGNNVVFKKDKTGADATYNSEGFRYYLNPNNEAVISRYIGGESNVTVPSYLDGHKVTAIAPIAFACTKDSGIVADDRYITKNQLVSISLPDTVEVIGKYAFARNLSLTEINIPPKVKTIPTECFSECWSLKEIVLPESVTEIGYLAFRSCMELEIIEMQGVEKVGDEAFYYCPKLSYTGYSEKLREIGKSAFSGINITGTLDLSSVTKIGAGAFSRTKITKVILNDNTEKLERAVFYDCELLADINYPSKLVSIGESCFSGSGINKADFNEGLKEIGACAFNNCKELYILELPESIEKIGNFAFDETLLSIAVIPENLKIIGYRAFGYCKELEILYFNAKNCKVDFYDEADEELDYDDLGNASPFIGCRLKEIHLGEGVASISGKSAPYGTFENCSSLESIIIPDTVSEIGSAAFKNCSSLETAVVPGSVTEIADDAFDGCDNLTIVCFENSYVYTYAVEKNIKVSTFVIAPIPNQTYTGSEIKPEVSVTFSGNPLHKNIDFGVSYANNINAGEADVTVKGKGDYKSFSNKVKFTIVSKSITSASIAPIPDQAYTGSAVVPKLIITDGSNLLCENSDYTASYSNNKNVGTATVKITGIGNYSRSISAEFRIVNMNGTESFFSRLLFEIKLFFAKISAFFTDIFSF